MLAELGLEGHHGSGTITSTRRSRLSVSTGKSLISRDVSPLPTEPAFLQKYEDHQSMIRFPSVRSVTRPRNSSRERGDNNNLFRLLDQQKGNLDERKESCGSLRSFRLTNYSQKYF